MGSAGVSDELRAAYAALPYPGRPYARTHPRNAAALARLHGLDTDPDVGSWRVLELGCGDGENVIGIAQDVASAVGVDLEPGAIAAGRALARSAGLTDRVRLEAADLTALTPADLGPERFDLVVLHGLLSWVPAPVREHALRLCAAVLAPSGVVFASFNALPGGRARLAVRDTVLRELGPAARDDLAAVRTFLGELRGRADDAGTTVLLDALVDASGPALRHDLLAEVNDHLTTPEFLELAARHGLQLLAPSSLAHGTPPGPGTRTHREQVRDVEEQRPHRQLLLCRAGHDVLDQPDPGLTGGLHAVAELRREADGASRQGGARLRSDHPALLEALGEIADAWPRAVAVDRLPSEARGPLLHAARAGVVDLVAAPAPVAGGVGRHPQASSLARAQAARDGRVTTAWHVPLDLQDALSRALVVRLDGRRDVSSLARGLGLSRDQAAELPGVLAALAARALLVSPC